jgi:hypothetical protein
MSEEEGQMLDEVEKIIKQRWAQLPQNYALIQEQYSDPYEWPEMDTLRHEICLDIVFGLWQSAMTLTNHMLESFLKLALTYAKRRPTKVQEPAANAIVDSVAESAKKYDSMELSSTINAACRAGLITKAQKKDLHGFRQNLRNAYSHAERGKVAGDASIPIRSVQVTDSGFVDQGVSEFPVSALPVMHAFAQCEHAKANAAPYFRYIDSLVRETMPKIFRVDDSMRESEDD